MRKCLPEVALRAVVSLYQAAQTKLRVRSELFQERLMQVDVHKGSAFCNGFNCNYGAYKRRLEK